MLATCCVVAAFVAIFALDRATDAAPVQHLYYFPIVASAIRFGTAGGTVTAAAAILLYHVANPQRLTWPYEEFDLLQAAVFMAVAMVSARLASDARRLHRLALSDDLTGLHNLRSFEVRLRRMVRAANQSGTPLSLCVLDVDRLKSINDRFGHLAGASAVQTVGYLIAAEIPSGAVACRYGGDEFAIAVPHCSAADATLVAERLREAVHRYAPVLDGVAFPAETLSISIGMACLVPGEKPPDRRTGDEDRTAEELFRAADRALYVAKNEGRNRVHVGRDHADVSGQR
jgi:diguanylate cyclase (GGDEF)-like protein